MNLRDEILAIDDTVSKEITIKIWKNKKILVKSFTAGERFRIIDKATDDKTGDIDNAKLTLLMVIASAYDPKTNERIFTEADCSALARKSSAAIDFIAEAMREINGIGENEVKGAEKN